MAGMTSSTVTGFPTASMFGNSPSGLRRSSTFVRTTVRTSPNIVCRITDAPDPVEARGTPLEERPRLSEKSDHLEMGNFVLNQSKRRDQYTVEKPPFYAAIPAFFLDALENALIWAMYRDNKPTNYYMEGIYAPVEEFGPEHVLSVKGDLPDCLNGEFVRVGPNPKFKPKAKYSLFDGDGMLHGVRIKDGKVSYICRYVKTSRFQQEDHWGGPKYRRIGDLSGKKGLVSLILFQLRVKAGIIDLSKGYGNANTALAFHNGKLLTLSEVDKPYVVRLLEDGDFETVARLDYNDKLNHPFTAHPKIDPVTGEMFTFGYQIEALPYITYRVISKDGVMGDPVPITPSGPIMMHDFAITENYAIFLDHPLYFNPKDMVKKEQYAFSFDGTKPARFGILPRYAKNESEMKWFECSTGIVFHNGILAKPDTTSCLINVRETMPRKLPSETKLVILDGGYCECLAANAWEEGDEVVLISCRSPNIDLSAVAEYDKTTCELFLNELWEYRFNMKTGKVAERRLGDVCADFPRINDEYIGRKNRFIYEAVMSDATHLTGIVKYDLTKEPELGKAKLEVGGNVAGVFWHGSQCYGSEPVYVPKTPGREVDEDDGYLLNFVIDENTLKSSVIVIDAKTMSADPVAVIELPARVPIGFHGMFVREDQLQLQKA